MNSYVMFHVLFVSFALVSLVVGLPVPRRLQRVSRQAQYGIHAFPGSRLPAVACFRSTPPWASSSQDALPQMPLPDCEQMVQEHRNKCRLFV